MLCWSYTIEGIAGGNSTGPCSPCPGADDPELKKGCVLYNLVEDPGERNNLATQQPDTLNKILGRMKELALESVEPQQWDPPFQVRVWMRSHLAQHSAVCSVTCGVEGARLAAVFLFGAAYILLINCSDWLRSPSNPFNSPRSRWSSTTNRCSATGANVLLCRLPQAPVWERSRCAVGTLVQRQRGGPLCPVCSH